MKPPDDGSFERFKANSERFMKIAAPWVDHEMKRIMAEDASAMGVERFDTYTLVVASDREDLEFATDYNATVSATHHAAVGFRGRDAARCFAHHQPVRQMTLRCSGRDGNREIDKVINRGNGDFYVTVWCEEINTKDAYLGAGIIVELAALRAMPPVARRRMEDPGMANVPFVGYDAATLIGHGMVRAAYPDEDYFTPFAVPVPQAPVIPGQEALL